ncbi:hypothetical protein LTR50_001186 [Elasticomyces elasticus]|nr:hypothetical protein LTR50_001186 [Elasticomyces elasticus]
MPTPHTTVTDCNTFPTIPSDEDVSYWTRLLRDHLLILRSAKSRALDADAFDGLRDTHFAFDEAIMCAPRRRPQGSTRSTLAHAVAFQLYPGPEKSLYPIIQYEKDIVELRRLVVKQRQADQYRTAERCAQKNWTKRIVEMGPWNEVKDPVSLQGASSLPMPVKISDKESLAPFFAHLRNGGDDKAAACGKEGKEPHYGVHLFEFEKGVLYDDHRLDLCKMVVGPRNIGDLMDSLETNEFTQHFLLGNNIIGPTGAKAIARFVDKYPNRMQTWYLAGNCIDAASFDLLVDSIIKSPATTNIWLKRNPLGRRAASDVYRLISQTLNLRTLDLDQTELGDDGVAELFALLTGGKHVPLRNIFLNASGIGESAIRQISRYLAHPNCTLEAMYMSNNPIGSSIAYLGEGLRINRSLQKLCLQSCGLTDTGTVAFLSSIRCHPTLRVLDIGQAYATEDLGMRYNWLTDNSAAAIADVINTLPNLEYINLDYVPMSQGEFNPYEEVCVGGLDLIFRAVSKSPTLLWCHAKTMLKASTEPQAVKAAQKGAWIYNTARQKLHENVRNRYGIRYEDFIDNEKRFVVMTRDVRLIDSVYRNRDAGLARRGLKRLEKRWNEEDETLERVRAGIWQDELNDVV